ncbi:MAG: hypothetical protein NTV34_07495 [Proteobacteria bacterium]|nr:hypothetical protein [Pseudomonadota bacterium]
MNTKKTHFWIIVMWVITACVTTRYSNEATDESDPLSKVRPLLAQPVQITVGNDANLTPDLSSDGQRLVYTTSINGNKEIILRDRRKNTQARLTWHAADDFAPVLSPDGTQVAFLTRRQDAAGDVAVMPTGGFTTSLLSERSLDVYSKTDTEELAPAWWPDGKHLLVPSRNTKARSPLLMRLNIESHEWLPWADRHGEFPEIAPGGNIIAYVRDGKIYLNSETGNSEKQLDVPTQGVWSRPRFVRPISKVESVQDDVQDLVAVRYQHDTNRDGRVDGGDAGVVWRIQFSPLSLKVLHTEQLTAATHNAFAPDLKQEGLFVTLQAKGALEIFKFPAIGQSRKEWVSLPESRWLNAMDNIYDRVFALNNTAARFESNNDGLAAITLRLRGIRELADKGLSLDVKIATSDLRAHYNADKTVEAVARCLDLFSDSIQDLVTLQAGKAGLSDRSRIEKVLKTLKTIREEFTYLPRGIMSRDDSSGFVSILIATIAQRSRDSSAARSELSRISKSVGARIRDEAKLVEAEVDGDLSGSIALESKLKLLLKEQIASPDVLRRAADRFIQSIENRHPDNEELAGLRQEISTLPFLPPLIHELVAKRFMTEKKHMVAVQEYRQILEDHCRDHGTVTIQLAKTYVDVAMTYGNTEEIDKSLGLLADCTKAQEADRIEVKVLRAQALVRRGVGLLREREFAVALKVFKEATVIDPENLGGWRGFIDALFQRKALSGEISALEQNFIKNQGSASATYAYGYALTYEIDIASSATAKISAIDDALQVIETAKDLNPSSIYPYQTLGWLHMQKGHWIKRQRAEGGLRGSTSALIAKTRALFGRPEQDQIELGVDSFLAAIYLAEDKSLERANLLQNLGEAYHELENHQKALLNLSERLSLAKSQPFSDRNSEASIYRLAGRSAFQTDELNLAESLQRKGLELWQAGGNDQQISYSMDALALTLREEGKFSESIVVYNDLRIRHLAAKRKMELYRTISNIGYCQFMNNDLDAALESFQSSDRGFMGTDLSKIATERGSAIELDVGGQASAAKGFDSTGLRNMNLTFTARIYDKLHRFGQSAEVYRQKIALLQSSVKEANSLSSAANQEEIIITRNNLGLALLNAGQLGEARNEYRTASIEAFARAKALQLMRP